MNQRIFFFDLLRTFAAVAVIVIHVLGPFRHELGQIPFGEWATAVTINGLSRWAVPVFIMITGALMLSEQKPFNLTYYVKRRLGKVLIPFIVWSLFYAYLSGWSADGYNQQAFLDILSDSYHHATYYHLGFFYYFIPLYLIIPFFQLMVRSADNKGLLSYLCIWLITSALFLARFDGPWSNQYWLYSGYLLLGYMLFQKLSLNRISLALTTIAGITGLFFSVYIVITQSADAGEYLVGRWLSYKTINTVAAASMIFVLCRYFAERISGRARNAISFISKHSLGIYILHPFFLWPVMTFKCYEGLHPIWFIPLWVVLSGGAALLASWLFSLSKRTHWLLP